MNIVNINDIEDLILAKHEIDLIRIDNNEIDGRSDLREFVNTYANLKYIYLMNNIYSPFNFISIKDNKNEVHYYLFIGDDNSEIHNSIINKIKRLKYNMNNLVKIPLLDIYQLQDLSNIIMYNGEYYN